VAVTGCRAVVKNGAGRSRALEGLDEETVVLRGEVTGPVPVPMNGATYMADVMGGQKTGLFFDQRPNHAFAARLARGARVLDVFAHVGGFALAALAGRGERALAVDARPPALGAGRTGGRGDRAWPTASPPGRAMPSRAGGAGCRGRTLRSRDLRPARLCAAKPALEAGLRAYERVARLAAPLVAPGGYLVLCSCSHAADLARSATPRRAASGGRAAGADPHTGFAGPDHPMLPQLAESGYLKALFFRLDG
jgi:23S rRNA (cytosine1962-C5)-methyltransferase